MANDLVKRMRFPSADRPVDLTPNGAETALLSKIVTRMTMPCTTQAWLEMPSRSTPVKASGRRYPEHLGRRGSRRHGSMGPEHDGPDVNHLGGANSNGDWQTWMPDIWGWLLLECDMDR